MPLNPIVVGQPTIRRFDSIELMSDQIPDETTSVTFHHLQEKHCLGEQSLETTEGLLAAQEVAMLQGTIVDVSLIEGPKSTKI